METNNTSIALEVENPYIIKKIAPMNVVKYGILLCVGVSILILSGSVDRNIEWLPAILMTLGIIVAGFAVAKLILATHKSVYSATGSTIKAFQLNFPTSQRSQLMTVLESKNAKVLETLETQADYGLQLSVDYSADNRYLSLQLYEYVPHKYEPISTVYHFLDSDAEAMLKSLLR